MASPESTRPATAWTSTSSGSSPPSAIRARSARVAPSSAEPHSAVSDADSTWSTETPGQAAWTLAFQAARSRAAAGSRARRARAAGAYSRSTYSRTIRPASTFGPRFTRVERTIAIQRSGRPAAPRS